MKEPDHKVKRHIVPFNDKEKPYWIENPVHGWLASGVKDYKGVEIYEGDIVRHEIWEKDIPVTFHDSAFWLGDTDCPLCYQFGKLLEIVRHIAEDNCNG